MTRKGKRRKGIAKSSPEKIMSPPQKGKFLWHNISPFARFLYAILGAGGLLLTYLTLYPNISVHPKEYRLSNDPASSLFVIANENIYPIYNVRCDYFIDSAAFKGKDGFQFSTSMNSLDTSTNIPMYFFIPKIGSKKEETFGIRALRLYGLQFAQMRIAVTFNFFWITHADTFSYQTFRNYEGLIEWLPYTYELPSFITNNK